MGLHHQPLYPTNMVLSYSERALSLPSNTDRIIMGITADTGKKSHSPHLFVSLNEAGKDGNPQRKGDEVDKFCPFFFFFKWHAAV